MKVTIKKPNLTQYFFRFEQEDGDIHYMCMWARINLDHDTYTMTATSDCGDYSYTWCCTPDSESFCKLMARIDKEYLLGKTSNTTVFNLDESKEKTIKKLQYICESRIPPYTSLKKMQDEINEIDYQDERDFLNNVENITEGLLDFEDIEITMEYPHAAKVFCNIFCDYLQPILHKEINKQPKGMK